MWTRTYTLRCEILLPVSVEEAFEVFEDPYNLARITPPGLGFRILTENLKMRSGAEIDYQFRWLGIPLKWKTAITEYEPPFRFVDEAVQSPYKMWRHQHDFRPTAEGVIVRDTVTYALPLGPIGRFAHAVSVARQLKEIFTYRQQAIIQLLGSEALQVREPAIA